MSGFTNKRKRDACEQDVKKFKNLLENDEKALYSLSDEWPMYNHPDGGTVKITPWGSLRQYVDGQSGETVTRFEDSSFADLSFASSQCYDLPSTPMSLNATGSSRSSPTPENMMLSPSCEAELYVVDGYRANGEHPAQESHSTAGQGVGQFSQEQEHYFGMMEAEEYSDGANDSMVM